MEKIMTWANVVWAVLEWVWSKLARVHWAAYLAVWAVAVGTLFLAGGCSAAPKPAPPAAPQAPAAVEQHVAKGPDPLPIHAPVVAPAPAPSKPKPVVTTAPKQQTKPKTSAPAPVIVTHTGAPDPWVQGQLDQCRQQHTC